MKTQSWLRVCIVAGTLAAGGAFAQSKSPVVTDVGAFPAEERGSAGAILFEDAMPRAHREAFGVRDTRAEVAAIGEGVMRATLAQVREEEQGPNTRAMGAPAEPRAKSRKRWFAPSPQP